MMDRIQLIKELSELFGPAGCEGAVAAYIRTALADTGAELFTDKMGNLIAHLPSKKDGARRVMLSAHMDEVGFMVTEIDEHGFLHFAKLGSIDPAVIVGRLCLVGNEEHQVQGVISAKGIHFQTKEEREKSPAADDLYIDIGVRDKAAAEALVSLGDFGTFDTEFLTFGENNSYISGKALDDRVGCAILIEVLRALADKSLPLDLYFCFTVREEISISGATVVANRLEPEIAFVLETTAIADLPDVPAARRVADVGSGGVLSLLDRASIYDRDLVDFALKIGAAQKIPVQVKRFVSGGNDTGHIQRQGRGVRCLALSAPTRYLHAPVLVAAMRDITAMVDLLVAMLKDLEKEKQ